MSINLSPPLSCAASFLLCDFLLCASGALNCFLASSDHVKMRVKKIMRLRCFQHPTNFDSGLVETAIQNHRFCVT